MDTTSSPSPEPSSATKEHTVGAAAPVRTVSRADIRTAVSSSTIGTTIEWYDFFLYGTAAGLVFDRLYFPTGDLLVSTLLAYATFAVGFIARPLGGLIFGHLGDRLGRKKTLVATMYIMGTSTFLIGAIPTYDQIGLWAPIILVLLRVAQGIAIGGEWGGAVLLSVEYAPRNRRGFFGSFPQLGLAFGLLLGTGAFTLLSSVMDAASFLAWGWRLAFFLSLLLVVVGVYLRSRVAETPSFQAAQRDVDQLERVVPLARLLKDRIGRKHLLLGMGSRYAEGVAYNLWAVFIIAYATGTVHIPQIEVLVSIMVASCFLAVFVLVWGRVSDSLPRRAVFGAGVAAVALSVYPAFWAIQTGSWFALTVTLVITLGVLYPMMYGPQSSFYAELFPAAVRYSGISVVYQLSGMLASGLTPLILTWLMGQGGLNSALMYVVATCVISLLSVIAIRRRDIAAVADQHEVVVAK